MSLIVAGPSVTMTSLELVEFINSKRKEGEAELQHKHFLEKVPLVIGVGCAEFSTTYQHPQNKQVYPMYRFPKREACLMAMSYSYDIQAKVFDRMTELEAQASKPTLPRNFAEALRLAADLEEQKAIAESQRDEAIATKALIGSKREATAMATASAAKREAHKLEVELDRAKDYATVKRMEMIYHGQAFNWRLLKSAAADLGIPPRDVFDQNYGTVKSYHRDVWREAYALDIEVAAEVV